MPYGTKLLALGALIAPAAAHANPDRDRAAFEAAARATDETTAHAAARGSVIFAVINGAPYRIEADKVPEAVSGEMLGTWIGQTGPLTGPDGRPACGNIMSKVGPGECETARTAAIGAREAAIKAEVDKAMKPKKTAAKPPRAKTR